MTDLNYNNMGYPNNKEYLEKGLPKYLIQSIEKMKKTWEIEDNGGKDIHWDINWCDLSASINSAEADEEISHEQAQYLRINYLRQLD